MHESIKTTKEFESNITGLNIPKYFVVTHPEFKENIAVRLSIRLIRFYQFALSPFISPACRYVPSCSEYTLQAIRRYGFFYGCFLGFTRIIRCHPFARGGFDPVP